MTRNAAESEIGEQQLAKVQNIDLPKDAEAKFEPCVPTLPQKFRPSHQQLRQIAESGVCRPFEKEFIGLDGRRVPTIVWAAAPEGISDAKGVCFVLDISRQKQTESKLLATTERLSLIHFRKPPALLVRTNKAPPFFVSGTALAAGFGWHTFRFETGG